MKQLYDFTRARPPALTERGLRAEAARRRLRGQTAILAVASVLIELCLLLAALLLFPTNPRAAVLCGIYLAASITDVGVLTVVFIQKWRDLILCL